MGWAKYAEDNYEMMEERLERRNCNRHRCEEADVTLKSWGQPTACSYAPYEQHTTGGDIVLYYIPAAKRR